MKKSKLVKDADLDIKFDDREYLSDMLEDFGSEMTPEELCYQLTAYESNGSVDFNKGLKDILMDEIEEPEFKDFEDYLDRNAYDMVLSIDDFDEMESGLEPFTIAQKTFYGDFNPGYHKYYTYDGSGNYKGYYDAEEAMKDYPEFYDNYYEDKLYDLLYDEDFKEGILKGVRQLLEQGY